jgi:hypothetical protein
MGPDETTWKAKRSLGLKSGVQVPWPHPRTCGELEPGSHGAGHPGLYLGHPRLPLAEVLYVHEEVEDFCPWPADLRAGFDVDHLCLLLTLLVGG